MVGKSHLLVGLTAGVVLDSVAQISGPHLVGSNNIQLSLVISKALYYFMVGFGALLPDIDNARSTMGKKLGWVSKEIQHLVGHRTLFHSFLGLGVGAAIAVGLEKFAEYLLLSRGYTIPVRIIDRTHMVLIAVLFGCLMHIAADALTIEGVPLLWPMHKYFGFPPNRHWRFRTGTWPEYVIVYGFMLLVGLGIYYSVFTV
ncbi:MAG TPA: metal-dependent hydrolase [Ktedonobacteraceae bacterium]|nr:metal-dependent hydrolase [Ktedonobacteraceae bacterium]